MALSIERDGARVAYEVSGPPDAPVVMLGHSLLCDGRMWHAVAPRLATRWRLINVDVRGHGGSTAPARFTMEDLAADWLAIMDREKVTRAALVGLSMGGMTAMRLALAAPDRVRGLCILDSSADPEKTWNRVKYTAMAEIVRRFGYVDRLIKIVEKLMFGATTLRNDPELVAREIARIEENDPKAIYWGVRSVTDRVPIRDQLGAIKVPVTVIVGEQDLAQPRVYSERIVSAIPQARLQIIPGAGHLSAIERPDEVGAAVEQFLASLDSPARHG